MAQRRLFIGTGLENEQANAEAEQYLTQLRATLPAWGELGSIQPFLVPSFTAIQTVKAAEPASSLGAGAQNMHWAESGAYTGEISVPTLRELGVDLVEIGHAERRRDFGETDALVNRKVLVASATACWGLICVGEQADDLRYGVQVETVLRQLKIAVDGR